MTTVLGIDEAGRGSVIGPMVIAGAMIDEKDLEKLKALGVKDSKLLTPEQREKFDKKLRTMLKDFVILTISASDIDRIREVKNLNRIEADNMAQIIRTLKADVAYVDAPQVSTEKFKGYLLALAKNHTATVSENKADVKYPIVSAASILAKVERDRLVEEIKKEVGFDFGVGYSHDARSIEFVKECLSSGKHLDFIRRSWVTVTNLEGKKKQKSVKDY